MEEEKESPKSCQKSESGDEMAKVGSVANIAASEQ
jgi:hypothetical protein